MKFLHSTILQLLTISLTLPTRLQYKPYILDEYTIHDCRILLKQNLRILKIVWLPSYPYSGVSTLFKLLYIINVSVLQSTAIYLTTWRCSPSRPLNQNVYPLGINIIHKNNSNISSSRIEKTVIIQISMHRKLKICNDKHKETIQLVSPLSDNLHNK